MRALEKRAGGIVVARPGSQVGLGEESPDLQLVAGVSVIAERGDHRAPALDRVAPGLRGCEADGPDVERARLEDPLAVRASAVELPGQQPEIGAHEARLQVARVGGEQPVELRAGRGEVVPRLGLVGGGDAAA